MKILAYIEQRGGILKKNAFETITAARNLASQSRGSFTTLLIGSSVSGLANKLGEYGAENVIVIEVNRLENYSPIAVANAIANVATKELSNVVLISNTSYGKDLAPYVAVKLKAGLSPDIISLSYNESELTATRAIYAGKAKIETQVTTEVKVFSLKLNVFTATVSPVVPITNKYEIEFDECDFNTRVIETKVNSGKIDVSEADIIITGGRGLKEATNFNIIENLAEPLSAAVGASRAVVDAGWRPHSEQVGQTGKTVSPSLYVACAVSGAVQHLAGMSSSKFIVAINKDKDAPIFSVADYGIIGDVFEVLPLMTLEVKALLGK